MIIDFGEVMKKRIIGMVMTAVMVVMAALSINVTDVFAEADLKEARFCSFVVPPQFTPGGEKGLFHGRTSEKK